MNRPTTLHKLAVASLATIAMLMAMSGCAGPPDVHARLTDRLLMTPVPAVPSDHLIETARDWPPSASAPLPALSLDQAVAIALQQHPALDEAVARYEAALGKLDQAGRWPNPTAMLAITDAPLAGKFLADAKYFVRLEQQLPISGRIGAAQEAAAAEVDRMRHVVTIAWRTVYREAVAAFLAVDLARRRVEVARENYEVAQSVHSSIARRVEAGAATGLQLHRAHVALYRTRVAVTGTEREFTTARHRLSTGLGLPPGRVQSVLPAIIPDTVPDTGQLIAGLTERHPVLLEAAATMTVSDRRADLADARGNIDLGLFWRLRYLGATDTLDATIGISVPLKIFDRNQGNRHAARAAHAEAGARLVRLRLELANAVMIASENVRARLAQWSSWMNEVVPAAEAAVAAAEAGYRGGGFSELEVLQAQLELFTVRDQSLDDLGALWAASLDLHLLSGDLRSWNPFRVGFSSTTDASE